jgi:excisionase family DNA binding protein
MYLSVQHAARRLGVSPVTIRRWTTTGFLPCTRTAGGHRRIDSDDIDELARAIGGSNHLAARMARERELDTLVNTSIALASRLDLTELLAEIARLMTSLLDCHFCAISQYNREEDTVSVLADYDDSGRRLPDTAPYRLKDFPLTRRVLDQQTTAVANVDDPHDDPAEREMLRRDGDKSLLMVPLVFRGASIGLLEIVDQKRSRHYSRQELRLCNAIAGQAAVALQNARAFADRSRSDRDIACLRRALATLSGSLPPAASGASTTESLQRIARAVCDAFDAISCVVNLGGESAGAFGAGLPAARVPHHGGTDASVMVATGRAGAADLTVAVTLAEPAGEGLVELLDLIAATASTALLRPSAGR